MNDPCNLTREQQLTFVPALLAAPCAPTYPQQMTTLASDWHDIDVVVDRIRSMRHVEKLNLLLQELAWDAVSKHPLSGVKADAK